MKNNLKYIGDSFVYNEKNRSLFKQIGFVSLFIIGSLIISLIIIQMLGYDMFLALEAIIVRPFQEFLVKDFITNISILGLSGLAFAVSYKAGLFNIGVSGQMMASGLAIVGLSNALTYDGYVDGNITTLTTTGPSGIILVVIISMMTGMFVSLIAGVLKVFLRVHEVVSTILINWIIFFLGKFLITVGPLSNPENALYSSTIHNDLSFYNVNLLSGFVGAIITFLVVAIIIWALFKYTIFGKKVISVGDSYSASLYSGYNIKTLQLSAFAITGLISGLLACVVYTGTATQAIPVPLANLIPIEGFNGIAIALIAFSNPLAIIPVSFIMSIFTTVSLAAPPFPNSMGNLIIGLVMYGTSIFAIAYKIKLITRIRELLSKKLNNNFTNKWNNFSENKINWIKENEKRIINLKMDLFKLKNEPELYKDKTRDDLINDYFINKKKLKNNKELRGVE